MRNSGEVTPIAMVDAAVEAVADETAAGANGIEVETTEVADEGTPAIEEDPDADATAETDAETSN